MVRLKDEKTQYLIVHMQYFNSTMVRLKVRDYDDSELLEKNFNSTMVRLKEVSLLVLLLLLAVMVVSLFTKGINI